MRLIVLGLAASWLAGAVVAMAEPPQSGTADRSAEICRTFTQLVTMAAQEREAPDAPPFGLRAPLRGSPAGSRCTGGAMPGRTSVDCEIPHRDNAAAQAMMSAWRLAAKSCFKDWDHVASQGGGDGLVITSPDGAVSLKLQKAGSDAKPRLEASATNTHCAPLEMMKLFARHGRTSSRESTFTKEPRKLFWRFFSAQACTGRSNDSGNFVVSCTSTVPPGEMPAILAAGRRIAEGCAASWRRTPVPGGDLYRDGSGYAMAVLPRDKTTFEMSMVYAPSRAGTATTAPAAAATPAIPQAPAQSSCTHYNDLFLMAKIGSEGGKSAAFTTTPRTLAQAYLGAQSCTGAKSGTGHTITCTTAASDVASAKQALAALDKGMAACRSDWFRVQWQPDDVSFLMPTGRAKLRVEKADGANVRTTMTYDTCRPLDDMTFSVGVGQWFDASGKQTGTAARLMMRYFGGTCRAEPAKGGRSNFIACVFPDLNGARAKSTAAEIVQTVKACQPNWMSKDFFDSWTFEAKNGFQMIVEAREGRPPGFLVRMAPSPQRQ